MPAMTRRTLRPITAALALAVMTALSGCSQPTQGTDAMVEESERVLAIAEDVIPHIASSLDLTIASTRSKPTSHWNELAPDTFRFSVTGELEGPLPSQSALQESVVAAGLVESVISEDDGYRTPGTEAAPKIVAFTEDRSVQVGITYVSVGVTQGLFFSVFGTEAFYVSDEASDEYFWDLVPEFDQSLVQPRKGIDEMTRVADRAVTDAEQLLPQIAQALDLTLTQARVLPQSTPPADGEADQFVIKIHGDFQGSLPTQLALEDAMIAAGLTAALDESEILTSPGSDEYPAFAAATPDGFLLLQVWAASPRELGLLNFAVEAAPESGFSRTAYQEFDPEALEFDQSLVQPRDSE